jgi:hypothetical protein
MPVATPAGAWVSSATSAGQEGPKHPLTADDIPF